jgi:hypothetical protein
MTLLPLIRYALELEKSHQISISLATCVSQCNISLVLGVSSMRSTFKYLIQLKEHSLWDKF